MYKSVSKMTDEITIIRHSSDNLITRTECDQILHNILDSSGECVKLLEFSIQPELSTIGYLGEYFHLHLSYEKDKRVQQTRLFVKTLPYQNPDMTVSMKRSGILKKEATLYQTLLNELRKISKTIWCAQCYLGRSDLFVMQNIVDLGYEPLQEAAGYLNEGQMRAVLKGLATMHACSIAYEVRNDVVIGEQLKHALYEVTISPSVAWYTAGIRAVLAVALKHPLYQSAEDQLFIRAELSNHLDCVYDMVDPSVKYRNVFCHRDPWGGNVFFSRLHPADTAAVFVDFQLCRYCPPAIDVLFAVYLNIPPRDRPRYEASLYRWYYDCFALEMEELDLQADDYMSCTQFAESLTDLKLFGALYNCIAATILRVPSDYLKKLKENHPQEFHRYTNVDRTEKVLELIRRNGEFREYMFDCIEDMMKIVYTKKVNSVNSKIRF